jgi:hypothetical protein
MPILGVSKKTEKPRKPEKKLLKKPNREKNRLNRLKFWKNRPVRFWFCKYETEKTEPSWKNQVKLVWTGTEPKPVGLNWFWFFLKKFSLVIFLYKIEPK